MRDDLRICYYERLLSLARERRDYYKRVYKMHERTFLFASYEKYYALYKRMDVVAMYLMRRILQLKSV